MSFTSTTESWGFMEFLDFKSYTLWVNVALFTISAIAVWFSGTRISEFLDAIAEKKKIGHGFIGMLFLGGVTSLPELATVGTASYTGNVPLAINNMLGSIAFNIILLAVADGLIAPGTLTAIVADASTLLQGTLCVLLMAIVSVAAIAGDISFMGLGLWSWLIMPVFIFSMWLTSQYRHRQPWSITAEDVREQKLRTERHLARSTKTAIRKEERALKSKSIKQLVVRSVIAGLIILFSGFLLAQTGDAIADQSGIGASFIGFVLVAFATSLPEISAVTAAVRLGRFEMAIGDVFGANLWNILYIAIGDVIYKGDPVMNKAGKFEAVACLLGVILTSIYLLGLLERRDRMFVRLGYDSVAALLAYACGLAVLYFIQKGQ